MQKGRGRHEDNHNQAIPKQQISCLDYCRDPGIWGDFEEARNQKHVPWAGYTRRLLTGVELKKRALSGIVPVNEVNLGISGVIPDVNKWVGSSNNFGPPPLQIVREIQGNRLHMITDAQGRTDTNSGENFTGNFLNFTNPENVTAIEATIQVTQVEITGCPGGSPDDSG